VKEEISYVQSFKFVGSVKATQSNRKNKSEKWDFIGIRESNIIKM